MVSSVLSIINLKKPILLLLTAIVALAFVADSNAASSSKLGVIKGVVRDQAGKPIEKATVAFFKVGTSKLLKQVLSGSDGGFLTRIIPGTYSILAVAEGFNPMSYSEVEVSRSSELVYRFNLEPSGKGNTLPEKKAERNSSKYPIRAAQIRRSIYQIDEGNVPIDAAKIEEDSIAKVEPEMVTVDVTDESESRSNRKTQSIVETYFASSDGEGSTGLNFATFLPVTDKTEVVVAGQTGTGNTATNRLETAVRVRANNDHKLRFTGSIVDLGKIRKGKTDESLRQLSFQALDEWNVREGIIFVYGVDYSKFVGSNGAAISPRFGLQFDVNSKTRFRAAYTTATEERTWQRALDLEGSQVLFREPVAMQDVFIENDRPQMNKNRRLEFGIERVLDNKSSIEANVFFDAVSGRGVGIVNVPFNSLSGDGFSEFVANQQGKAQGLRVVYTRRINGMFSTSAGYAFGNGQRLSNEGTTNPAKIFENDFFQTFVGQFDAEFDHGTSIKTVFRLSPQATVFAIDPFAGRMAIYDPSLSILITQSLPNWGLPFRAEAIVDARNLLDFQSTVNGEEGSLRLNSQRLMLRGGISVRF
jgi:hypothetical protein